jgi:hypothetical protein
MAGAGVVLRAMAGEAEDEVPLAHLRGEFTDEAAITPAGNDLQREISPAAAATARATPSDDAKDDAKKPHPRTGTDEALDSGR